MSVAGTIFCLFPNAESNARGHASRYVSLKYYGFPNPYPKPLIKHFITLLLLTGAYAKSSFKEGWGVLFVSGLPSFSQPALKLD